MQITQTTVLKTVRATRPHQLPLKFYKKKYIVSSHGNQILFFKMLRAIGESMEQTSLTSLRGDLLRSSLAWFLRVTERLLRHLHSSQ